MTTNSKSQPQPSNPHSLRRASILWRLSSFFLIVVVAICLFVGSGFATSLIVVPQAEFHADYVLIVDSECGPCYRIAAQCSNSGSIAGVLLRASEHKRLVLLGAVLPTEELGRLKLIRDGVSKDSVHVMPGICRIDWDAARHLDTWLEKHPDSRVSLLCDRFSSQRWSLLLDRSIDNSRRSRASVEGVVDPRYDESNWWRSRTGIKAYMNCMFQLQYARWHGADVLPVVDWTPELYESAVLEKGRRRMVSE